MSLRDCITCDGGDAGNKRPAENYGLVNSHCCADILADNTHLRRQSATGHLLAGENFNQLFFTAGGIFGWEGDDFNPAALGGVLQSGQALGFVVFDPDQCFAGCKKMAKYFSAGNNLLSALTHQHIVCGNIGLALSAIQNQCCDGSVRFDGQFDGGGEAGASHPGDAGLANQV